ncbi:hypothetical protein RHOM_05570 [Roseburia hominis A2-183]|uniref:Uncharacterized protein n=1 Tax=Roseburia hominis (strain DSM 16839 / JCM 17582 / NCIMB 14029 / A2-183) TaxID=585394 RepID=G2T2L0_ROSHA|nr:hypothetical protein RHOM_05570 [Roseburia hominis A2-183]
MRRKAHDQEENYRNVNNRTEKEPPEICRNGRFPGVLV